MFDGLNFVYSPIFLGLPHVIFINYVNTDSFACGKSYLVKAYSRIDKIFVIYLASSLSMSLFFVNQPMLSIRNNENNLS